MTTSAAIFPVGDKGGLEVRAGGPADVNFIYATWLRSYRHSSQFAARIQDAVFYRYHQAAIARILQRGAAVNVCTPQGEPELILGYAVAEGCVLHFVYVKKPFRRGGIGLALAGKPELFTHWTKDWDSLKARACPEAQYNPYLI